MVTPTAEGTGNGAADSGLELVDGFRRTSPYFKWRMAIVASWLVLSVASVAFAFTGGDHNDLGAAVTVVDAGFVTALDIQNHGGTVWKDVTVTLSPGHWIYRQANVRPGDRLALEVTQFARPGAAGQSERPQSDFMPRAVTIRTDAASYTKRLHGHP